MPKFNSPDWAVHIDNPMATGLINAVSQPRLTAYGLTPGQNFDSLMVVAKHGRNIVLCESLYPILHMLEVVLRNRVHDAFTAAFGGPSWFDQTWVGVLEKNMIQEARADLVKKNKQDTPDNIVAALSFGFWCSLFNARYETTGDPWPSQLKSVLPKAPKSVRTRSKIQNKLEAVRRLRNRVFHHEPIAHFNDLAIQYRDMLELLGWFSPEAMNHVGHICRFYAVHGDRIVENTAELAEGNGGRAE